MSSRHRVSGRTLPMREIALSAGVPPLRLYDASVPQGADVRDGLPPFRRRWILGRDDVFEAPSNGAAAAVPPKPPV
jgi:hypothetical protein